jgi:hypothetical protein
MHRRRLTLGAVLLLLAIASVAGWQATRATSSFPIGRSFQVNPLTGSSTVHGNTASMSVSFRVKNLSLRPATTWCNVSAPGFPSKTVELGLIPPGHSSVENVLLTGSASALPRPRQRTGTYTVEAVESTVRCR